jgi:hypothetical protein
MEEALHDVPPLGQFTGLDAFEHVMSDKSSIPRFWYLLEKHDLAGGDFCRGQCGFVGKLPVNEALHCG